MNLLKENLLQMGFKQKGKKELGLVLPNQDKSFGDGAIILKSQDWDALHEEVEVKLLNDKGEEVLVTQRIFLNPA